MFDRHLGKFKERRKHIFELFLQVFLRFPVFSAAIRQIPSNLDHYFLKSRSKPISATVISCPIMLGQMITSNEVNFKLAFKIGNCAIFMMRQTHYVYTITLADISLYRILIFYLHIYTVLSLVRNSIRHYNI